MTDRRLEIRVREKAQLGWGGVVAEAYPWNRYPSTLAGPPTAPGSQLERLLRECALRLGTGATIALDPNYRVVDDDRLRWAARDFAEEFPELIGILVKQNLATTDAMGAQGSTRKLRVRFETTFPELLQELSRTSRSTTPVGAAIDEAMRRIAG